MSDASTARLSSDASRATSSAALRQACCAAAPDLYRSEAFAEDLELLPAPQPLLHVAPPAPRRAAAWLLALPQALAWLASAVLGGGLPH